MANNPKGNSPKVHKDVGESAREMIFQLREIIDTTDNSFYTLNELIDILIKTHFPEAYKQDPIPPSVQRIYEVFTENELKKLCDEGLLVQSVSDGQTYYKI